MKKSLTRGEKLLFLSPLLCLALAGAVWLRRDNVPDALMVEGATTISSLDFSPDSRRLLVNFQDRQSSSFSTRIYDVKSRSKVSDLQRPSLLAYLPANPPDYKDYRSSSWSGDGKSIVAHNNDEVAIWDTKSGLIKANYPYPPTRKYVRSWELRFSPDGKTLVGEGVPPAVYDVMTGRRLNRSDGGITDEAQIELSGNGRWVARLFIRPYRFDVVDAKTKRLLWEPKLNGEFSSGWSGDVLCVHEKVTSEPRRILLWNGRTLQQMPSLPQPFGADIHDAVGQRKLNPRHKTLAYYLSVQPYDYPTDKANGAVTYKSELIVWDFGANQVLWRRKFDDSLSQLLWSPDGNWLSVVIDTPKQDERLLVFDKTGKLRYERKNVLQANWSPDSKQLAVAILRKPLRDEKVADQIEILRFDG